MARTEWEDRNLTSQAGIAELHERQELAGLNERERREICWCRNPVPDRRYLGSWVCKYCSQLIHR